MSLPGAASDPIENQQPTIIELLNPVYAISKDTEAAAEEEKQQTQKPLEHETKALNTNLVTNDVLEQQDNHKAQLQTQESIHSNVLDIESHLIETLSEYTSPEDSVGINEVQPIPQELSTTSSKIETNENVRSVIEVEPAGLKSLQPLQVSFEVQTAQLTEKAEVEEEKVKEENLEPSLEKPKLQSSLEAQTVTNTAESTESSASLAHEKTHESLDISSNTAENIASSATLLHEQVHKTAADLLDELDHKLQKVFSSSSNILENLKGTEPKTEPAEDTALSQKVDERLSEVTSILKSSKNTEANVNLHLGQQLKVVDVPVSKTESEEQERKLFLDSLPQIENANRLSADCKKEYYQSLRKYLLDSENEKPPVPLQTYRWEDLRRAKERVSIYQSASIIKYQIFLFLGWLSLDTFIQTPLGTG